MLYTYVVFGLKLRVNFPLPGLDPDKNDETGDADVEVRLRDRHPADSAVNLSEKLAFTSSITADSGEPMLRVWKIADDTVFCLDYFDGMKFWVDRDGKSVWADWSGTLTTEDAATYLLGPVLGLVLRLRGFTCLHASAVAVKDSAIAFVGEEGAGKSTTAAAMARRGYAVISDDIVALKKEHDVYVVVPAYPYLCLWQNSVEALYGTEKELPRFSENWDKRMLSLRRNAIKFADSPLPLAAIFLLGERTADDHRACRETIPPQEALFAFVANSYATSLLEISARAREFHVFGELAGSIPVLRLRRHQDLEHIDRICDEVLKGWRGVVGAHCTL